jgi:hypothetical protein
LGWHGNCLFVGEEWLMLEILGLPLAEDGLTVNKLLIGMVYKPDALDS